MKIKKLASKSSKIEYVSFNEETRKAIIRAYAEEKGIISNTSKTYNNVDDAISDLFSEKSKKR